MDGPAVARWVRRHSQEERFRAALALSDAAIEAVSLRVRAENPRATARDVRAYIKRMRNG
jgi:hypothetical protein